MVVLRSGRDTSVRNVAIIPEKQSRESTAIARVTTKRRHDTDDSARNAYSRPRLNSPHFKFGFEPGTPLVLSPTSTASTVATSEDLDDSRDSPDGTRDYFNETSASEASIPMTPPTVCDTNGKVASNPKLFEVIQTSAAKSVAKTDVVVHYLSRFNGEGENNKIEQEQAEDYFFKPKKLFRNLTKVFQAIADANALAVQGNYMLESDFDFESSPDQTHAYPQPRLLAFDTIKDDTDVRSTYVNVKSEEDTVSSLALSKQLVVLEHIVPYSINIRLAQESHTCVASKVKTPHDRCTSKRPSGNIDKVIKDISECDFKANHARFLGCIKELAFVAMCGTHQNAALSSKRQRELKALLSSMSHQPNRSVSNIQVWVDAISNNKSTLRDLGPVKHVLGTTRELAPGESCKAQNTPAARPAAKKMTTNVPIKLEHSPHFSPYQPKRTKNLSVSQVLQQLIIKPLKPTDKKRGYIYLFWDKEHFGKLKIGRTKDLEQRLKQWNSKCGRIHAYHPAISRGELPEIPHVSRVEDLIHAELKDCRRKRACTGCNKIHEEWFEVSDGLALEVFQKWQNWITQEPYALDTQTGEWILRSEMMETLSQVCEPVSRELRVQPTRQDRAGKGKRRFLRRAKGSRWAV